MMNKTRLFAPRIFALIFALIFSSCSMPGDGFSSVSVSLGPAALNQISARNGGDDGDLFTLTVSLKGDYTGTQTARITSAGTKITFSEIPDGSKVYAEGSITADTASVPLYTGRSEEICVSGGENLLSLALKKLLTVTFSTGGGTPVESQSVEKGRAATEPPAPAKTGSVFSGWYTDSGLSTKFNFSTPITDNITLYAKWKTPGPITLIYDNYSTTADKQEFDECLPANLFDNDANTKFCINIRTNDAVIEGGLTILFHTSNPCLITKYSLTQGNDTSGFQNRAPVAWQIFGSDSSNGTFELIETQDHTADDAPLAFNTNEQPFNCTATKAYTYYKFVINRLYGTTDQYGYGYNTVQLAELKFYGDESD